MKDEFGYKNEPRNEKEQEMKSSKAFVPEKITYGDTIGICSPSHIMKPEPYANVKKGIEVRGFRVKEAGNLFSDTYGYSATELEKAEDFHELASDPQVKMVFFDGGDGSMEVLPHLDYEFIKQHPKQYHSFSDGTSILNAIYLKTGMITYYGQAPGLYPNISAYDYQQFLDFAMNGLVHEMKKNSKWRTLNSGVGTGTLIGGYLLNFAMLLGSQEFCPPMDQDYILFIEDHEMFFQVPYVSALLSQIEQHSFMSHVKGILFGNYSDQPNDHLDGRLARIGKRWDIPVCYCDDFGHGKNHAILAIGAKVTLDADRQSLVYNQELV